MREAPFCMSATFHLRATNTPPFPMEIHDAFDNKSLSSESCESPIGACLNAYGYDCVIRTECPQRYVTHVESLCHARGKRGRNHGRLENLFVCTLRKLKSLKSSRAGDFQVFACSSVDPDSSDSTGHTRALTDLRWRNSLALPSETSRGGE